MARRRYQQPAGPERLLLHALGLGEYKHTPYRNHFVAGPGHLDIPELDSLVKRGLMVVGRRPGMLPDDSIVYYVTDEGRRVALEIHRDCLPKLTRAQKRYDRWLEVSDYWNISFGDWLRKGCPG